MQSTSPHEGGPVHEGSSVQTCRFCYVIYPVKDIHSCSQREEYLLRNQKSIKEDRKEARNLCGAKSEETLFLEAFDKYLKTHPIRKETIVEEFVELYLADERDHIIRLLQNHRKRSVEEKWPAQKRINEYYRIRVDQITNYYTVRQLYSMLNKKL